VSIVTQRGFRWFHPSMIRLSWLFGTRISSINRGVEVVDAGVPLFLPVFTRFPSLGLLKAAPACGLCAGVRRTRTASTMVVPHVGDLIADLL
jgi:hypothetical protein